MNYLAHSFLTFSDGQIVGQFLEDFIRNKDRYSFPKDIQDGITLHRAVDTFTDSHPAIHEAKKVFSPLVRLYAGAFVDVAMDYFVATDLSLHSLAGWKAHSLRVYSVLNEHEEWLPENFKKMLAKMEEDDWLYNYREDWGIQFSMRNVLNKARYLEPGIPVYEAFLNNKPFLQECYDGFFPDLRAHAQEINAQLQLENGSGNQFTG
ncbi:ACP phosphodiesterase [Chryseobacterium angstadtii]|uniref:ACP phosphodiesterase n=1 Tax=Chryseobacterium angstadtii TaxID=558151 RepID=A0A0J7HZN3_9FLAO|nr:ACP phosphodiesterase [Chryseobacterium angstadtii]KMQ59502.1 ACP phosphodiesterase [Chryseobacterium angstadtii]